jgi:hypothetical protein
MSTGLFASHCPACGGELTIDRLGNSACVDCNRVYLLRFGYLIPFEIPLDRPLSLDRPTLEQSTVSAPQA